MRRVFRLSVLSFLLTTIVVMAMALRSKVADRRAAVAEVVDAAQVDDAPAALAVAELKPAQASLGVFQAPSFAFLDRLTPTPEPPPPPVEVPEGWSPPTWFPEVQEEALFALQGIGQAPSSVGPELRLASKAVFVYDLESGEALYARNADDRRPVASLTKLVSALTVASEAPDLDETVCLDSSNRPSWPGAVTRIRRGTCATGWDFLGAAVVRSDNGAAYTLPKVAGLPHYPFVERMNAVAAELGMDQSTFSDPSGAEDDNLSTARDITRAVVAASLHPSVQPVASAHYWDFHNQTRGRRKRLTTTNKLWDRRGTEVLAAKTGYTDTARHCFSTVVRTRNGRKVAITVLGGWWSRHRWSDMRKILAWVERGAPGAGEPIAG